MSIDAALCEALASRAVRGENDARRQLVEHLWPAWVRLARASRGLSSLSRADDAVHEVVARLIEKIGRPESRELGSYFSWHERHPDKDFGDWMRIVEKNVIRDYVREQLGPHGSTEEPGVKRLLNEFAASPALEELGARPPLTLAQTARELLEFAAQRLPADQLRVLTLWLEGESHEEIGKLCAISSADARNLLRAGIATVRRQFSTASTAT